MNLAFFLKPKNEVEYALDTWTLRQGLEKLQHHGYTAIPVLNRDGKYVGTVSEGDFLWFIAKRLHESGGEMRLEDFEELPLSKILKADRNTPVPITADIETLLSRAAYQNFVPVTDDRGFFIGIITRSDIITKTQMSPTSKMVGSGSRFQ